MLSLIGKAKFVEAALKVFAAYVIVEGLLIELTTLTYI